MQKSKTSIPFSIESICGKHASKSHNSFPLTVFSKNGWVEDGKKIDIQLGSSIDPIMPRSEFVRFVFSPYYESAKNQIGIALGMVDGISVGNINEYCMDEIYIPLDVVKQALQNRASLPDGKTNIDIKARADSHYITHDSNFMSNDSYYRSLKNALDVKSSDYIDQHINIIFDQNRNLESIKITLEQPQLGKSREVFSANNINHSMKLNNVDENKISSGLKI